jgi:hypothetical protein
MERSGNGFFVYVSSFYFQNSQYSDFIQDENKKNTSSGCLFIC